MREWKNKLARFLLVLSVLCMAVNLGSVRNVQAAEGLNLYKRVPFYNSQKVGGSIYSLKYNDSTKRYNIYVEKNGKKVFLRKTVSAEQLLQTGNIYIMKAVHLRREAVLDIHIKGAK